LHLACQVPLFISDMWRCEITYYFISPSFLGLWCMSYLARSSSSFFSFRAYDRYLSSSFLFRVSARKLRVPLFRLSIGDMQPQPQTSFPISRKYPPQSHSSSKREKGGQMVPPIKKKREAPSMRKKTQTRPSYKKWMLPPPPLIKF